MASFSGFPHEAGTESEHASSQHHYWSAKGPLVTVKKKSQGRFLIGHRRRCSTDHMEEETGGTSFCFQKAEGVLGRPNTKWPFLLMGKLIHEAQQLAACLLEMKDA